jgi:hypothetical protein
VSEDSRFQISRISGRPRVWKSMFYTFISDYSLKLWKTPNVTSGVFSGISRDFGKTHFAHFDISGISGIVKSICFLYTL